MARLTIVDENAFAHLDPLRLVLCGGRLRWLFGDTCAGAFGHIDLVTCLAGIDGLVFVPANLQLRQSATIEGTAQRMIDHYECAGHAEFEFGDGRATGWNCLLYPSDAADE